MISSGLGHATLPGLLRFRAGERPERDAFIFLADGEDEGARLTWAELDGRARAIACALRASLAPGDRALLLYPPGLEFIAAFFGCLYAGVVAVPAYPPRSSDRAQTRLSAIARDATPRAALTTSAILAGVEAVPELAALRWIATEGLPPADVELPEPDPDSIAFLQYTSGSTATPKGVMVTHANLLHNERMIGDAFAMDEDSVVVGWLPLYHDMGLIGNVLQPLHAGGRCVLMSPVAFLQRPLRWLAAISHYRATTSGGPNFAYDLCVRRIGPEDRAALDLSSWRVAFNGAEPVRAETLERFAAAFAPCGFRPQAFYPCYGLAEATLFVSGGAANRPPKIADVEERPLVSCGHAWGGQRIAIVDPEAGVELAPGRTGEIWIAGPSVARGYWRNPEATQRDFRARLADTNEGPFLRTGDLGALRDGELYVTGRIKDLIILRGRNHYPQDLELTAERSHPDLRPGCGAAFSVEAGAEERLVMVQEVERHRRKDFEEVAAAIRRAVAEEHEVQVHEVVLVRAGSVPKTSSGKIQRRLCRELYRNGELAVLGRSAVSESPAAETSLALTRDDLAALDPAERPAILERFLRERAAAALGTSPGSIDPQQPLTAHGLDSLAAIELKGAVEAALGVELPMAELLEGAGIGRLAELLARTDTDQHGRTGTEQSAPWPSVVVRDRPCSNSLSYGERALWFLHRLAPEASAYNIAVAARTRGLDPEWLRRSLEAVALRHAAFRTVFPAEDGQPRRQVLERPAVDWQEEEATGWSETRLQERLAEEAWRPFSLEAGPLLRVRLFHRGSEEPVLLFVVHHIVADFASLAIVVRDLTGEGAPPPSATYADFAAWQEALLAGPRGERLWDYWHGTLAGLPDLDLPTDRPRPPVQTWRGVARALELPPGLTDRVRALAAAHGSTLYTVLLAAFAAQLGRTSGQRDFAVGAPAAGRGAPEWAGVVGYFVNPVVLRADLEGEPTFSSHLDRMRRTVLDGLAMGDFPFPLLAERLRPARDPARAPLFQAMFLLQRMRPGDPAGLGLFSLGETGGRLSLGGSPGLGELESLRIEERRAQLDLTLRAAELPSGGLGLSLEVSAGLFDAATAERMLGHFQTLLAGAAADPDLPLTELPWLTAAERAEILTEWSVAPALAPQDLLLHQPFEEQAARTPQAEALVAGTERLTYEELNHRASQLAYQLRRLGVGPEVRVGVRLGRTPDLVVSLLAVLKAGGAYVPLDPGYPEERLALMLEDSGARVVVGRGGVELRHRTDSTDPTDRTDHPSDPSYPSGRSEPPRTAPGNLAYLVYTSGSTGRPKAVGIEHRSASALVQWARGFFRPEELAGVLASTSVAFDLSVFELFVPLSVGGRVILAGNALELPRLPAASEVTLVNTVPSALTELVRGGGVPSSVRTVNLGGEAVPPALVDAVYGIPGIERLYNLYGPSEDTVYSMFALLAAGRGVTIGRPIDGTRTYVLDARLEPLPAGVPGELFLGGAGLARGYLGRPELTAERFVPDPFGGEPGARLYRTGDLARWRPGGAMEFLGRTDHQVKVRGFRIELGEIEAALARLPGVREAVVLALDDANLGRRLVAFAVPEGRAELPAAELREGLRRTLPEHMIPSVFVPLEKLPLSPNGKVDRRELARLGSEPAETADGRPRTPAEARLCELFAEMLGAAEVGMHESFFDLGGHSLLATRLVARIEREFGIDLPVSALFEAPTVARLASRLGPTSGQWTSIPVLPAAPAPRRQPGVQEKREQPYEAPRTSLEERLVELWASVLGRGQVGIHDDFFDLGGHSLLGARLLLEARQSFGVDLPLAELFDARTPAALAERLERAGARLGPETAAWPEPPRGAVIAPLSFAQQRLWLLHRLDPDSAAYHVPGVLTLSGTLHPEVLAAALEEIVRRHGALRTVFAVTREEPVQAILPPAPRALALVDLGSLPDASREIEASRLAAIEARRPFDLAAGPLLRTLLIRTAAAEHRLVLVMHHIVSDGWSLGVLRAELAALVAESPLPLLSFQYSDFAEAQRRELSGNVLERQLAHWRTRLDGAPALELPTDRPRPAALSDRGAAVTFIIPADVAQGLRELAQQQGATLFMALLASWAALLSRYSGQDDLTIGTPVAGRDRREVEPLIGCFVNTLPLRVRMEDDPPFASLLRHVREATLAAYDHQSVPFEKLVEDLAPERDRGRTPLFQVMLALHNAPQPALVLPGLELALAEIPTGTAKFDLSLLLTDGADGLAGTLEARTDLFEEATAKRLAAHLQELLAGAVRAPQQRLSDLPLLTAAESQQILTEWSVRDVPFPRATIHALFEEQAALRPEAPAVEQGDARLTYGELNARANRLAWRLRRLGVGPDEKVALLLERSLELVVGMLATLKAGGAYLPLDPVYPAERLDLMLRDSGARVLVTRGDLAMDVPFSGVVVEIEDRTDPTDRTDLPPVTGPENLAYVVYTSGSTGRPKGVEVPHRGVVRLVRPQGESGHARCAPDETFLHLASPLFDAATLEVWGPLLSGGRLVVMPGRVPALSELGQMIARTGVTTLWLTTGLFHLIVEERLDDLRPLRRLMMGGELTQSGHLRKALEALPGCELVHCYGPTENTTFTTAYTLRSGDDPGDPAPIGRPIAATRVYLLDRSMQPVPAGVPGELYTGGDGLARGYLNRPELTAERFVPDPFGRGARLYRTGDLVRWRPDGAIEFLGRIDQQVKIRGFRIELGEVETALGSHPEVAAAAVLVRDDLPGGKGLVAFVVRRPGTGDLMPALRAHLQARLPEPMMPALFLEVPELPLSPTGKVDRRALARLFTTPLAARSKRSETRQEPIPRIPRGADAALPLSFAQERLWVLDRLQQGSAAYNMPLQVRLRGALAIPELAAALAAVVSRHETLRTAFTESAGHPIQAISPPPADWPLPLVDLAGLSAAERDSEALRLAKEEARQPFRLDAGPILRTSLLRLEPGEHLLLLNIHHIATDGWSMGLLLAELQELYGALQRNGSPRLPDLPVQYADFAVWQRSRLDGEVLEREVAWWREQLRGLPELDLPTDRPRPAVPSGSGSEVPVALGPDLSRELAALARTAGATPFMVLLSGWSALLAGWSGQRDLSVGGPVAGRTRKETENLIGFFVNSLVLRCDLRSSQDNEPDFSTLLERARRTVLDAHAHQELPFEKLVDALQPRRDLARAPLFQVMLALQAFSHPALELDGVVLEPEPVPTGTAKVDLTLHLRETADGFAGMLEYAADLFDRETVERLADGFRALLAAAVADPGLPLTELARRTSLPVAAQRQIAAAPPPVAGSEATAGYVPPRTDLERTLCAAWAEALALERVGVRESFFEIGGNSLAMVRLHSRLGEILGREVPIATLFSHPTIESLAKELSATQQPAAASDTAGDARERTELRRASLRQLQQARGNLRGRK